MTETDGAVAAQPVKPPRAGHPVPGLEGPALQFDLAGGIESLKREDAWNSAARNAKTIVKYPDLRVVLVVLKAGKRIEGHRADESVSIQVLRGRMRLHLPQQTVDLVEGRLLTLERAIPHDVEALEDTAFLLTLPWPASAP